MLNQIYNWQKKMKLFSITSNQSIRLIASFIYLVIPSLACQLANQIIPIPTQLETLPASLTITEIPIPTNTTIGCPPNFLTEIPNPDVRENYIGQYILVTRNAIPGLMSASGQLVGKDHYMSNYVRNDRSHLLLWEKEHCRLDDGQLIYTEIIDAVITPPLAENQAFAIGCHRGKDVVPYVQAIIDINNNNVYFVWQVDINANKIVEIPIDGLSCSRDIQDFQH